MADTTEIVFLLDRSGSMHRVMAETLVGFNEFLAEQKQQEGDARFTLILFDDEYLKPIDAVYLPSVEPLTTKTFFPRGMTALYDAVGRAIKETEASIEKRDEEFRPERVLFVILTDGLENASLKYSRAEIAKMIREKERGGWKFLFLGANIDAFTEGNSIGISSSGIAQMSYQAIENRTAFSSISGATASYRAKGIVDENWADGIKNTTGDK